jgi:hypothetical protein
VSKTFDLRRKRFGPLDAAMKSAIETITEVERLESERVLDAENGKELLDDA